MIFSKIGAMFIPVLGLFELLLLLQLFLSSVEWCECDYGVLIPVGEVS